MCELPHAVPGFNRNSEIIVSISFVPSQGQQSLGLPVNCHHFDVTCQQDRAGAAPGGTVLISCGHWRCELVSLVVSLPRAQGALTFAKRKRKPGAVPE